MASQGKYGPKYVPGTVTTFAFQKVVARLAAKLIKRLINLFFD